MSSKGNSKSKKQSRSKSANKPKSVKVGDYPRSALSRVLSRVATTIAVAASGKTKDGDRAQVKTHQRKATQKQVRSKVAGELLKETTATHHDLEIESRKNSDGSISHFDRLSGWEVRRVTANGSVLEQSDIKDLRRF